jgi:hypothetical protein
MNNPQFLLSSDGLADWAPETICDLLNQSDGHCVVDVPMPSIGTANSPVSIAADYGDALFVGESLLPCCATLRVDVVPVREIFVVARFRAKVKECRRFAEVLHWLVRGLDPESGESEGEEVHEAIADLLAEVPFRRVSFPELADSYMINEVYGQEADNIGSEAGPEEWERFFPKQPETRFGFVRSSFSEIVGRAVYVSPRAWVVQKEVDVAQLLEMFRETGNPDTLRDATLISRTSDHMIFSDSRLAVEVRSDGLKQCLTMLRQCGRATGRQPLSYSMTSSGENFVAWIEEWGIVLFAGDVHVLPSSAIEGVLSNLHESVDLLRSCLGRPTSIQCDWDRLDDEQFERLCCDVLAATSEFDHRAIKKMGKSRSRDGGRDIEATSRARLGLVPKKWIFQCKALAANRSLSGSRVTIADVIDQFGAEGFGVMTSGLIDATLWDKLEAIAKRRGISYDAWDQTRLENFLADHREIRERYFDH